MLNITRFYSTSPSTWPRGTPTQNFGCTHPTQSSPSVPRPKNLVFSSVATQTTCVPTTRQNHCQGRLLLPCAEKLQGQRRPHRTSLSSPTRLLQDQQPLPRIQSHSTSRRTRSMLWETTRTTSSGLVQQTALRHKMLAVLSLDNSSAYPCLPLPQKGELEHRRVKRIYKQTNKVRFVRQIAKHERRQQHYRKYINTLRSKTRGRKSFRTILSSNAVEATSPWQHYSVAKKDRDHVDFYEFANQDMGDPALEVGQFSTTALHCADNFLGFCHKIARPPPRTNPQTAVRCRTAHIYRTRPR